ncbi:unnamed protein product [Paramecium sonneborni]|uniref:TOG domain-containing protein n=1 Tax=Paramecium sonneborni TaxID=65129 RepID=A0A8S1QXX9_9CILI|nr:unnamed protein product [Paramecium sonneborni]
MSEEQMNETKEAAEPYKPVDFKGDQQNDEQKVVQPSYGNDDIPIGKSSNKQMIDEYPPEGYVPKKAAPKKAAKKPVAPPVENDEPKVVVNPDEIPLKPAGQNVLDDQPVGGGKKFAISEYPEGMEGGGEDVQQTVLPLAQRLKSKAWKLRQSAFEEMAELFQKDESIDEYYEEWPKLINDNNPGSQEKALIALQIFIAKSNKGQFAARFDAKETIRMLIDKCIAPGKKQIVKLSYEIFFDIFERRDKQEMFDVVVEMLKNKVQKVQCAAIQSLIELLITFGPKRLDYLKPFFPEIEKLSQSTVSSIKTECMNFYKEAHKWLGEPILAPFIKGLKKLQLEELEKFQKEWQPIPMVPTRGGDAVTVGQGGGANNGLDAYDLVDAYDIFNKYNEKWCDKVLAQTKWNEKQALLDQLLKEAATPKIATGNYVPMIAMIKKLLVDSNQVINVCAIKLCGAFVKGLRKNFTAQAKLLFPLLIVKLREKKNICQEARAAMELFHYSLQVEDVVEDFKEGLADKNPQMRAQCLLLFAKLVQLKGFPQGAPKPKFVDCVKQLLPLAKKLIEDSVPDVREASVQSLGTLKPYLSDQLINTFYGDIGQQKLSKINEISSQIEEEKKKEQIKKQPPQSKEQQNASQIQQSNIQNNNTQQGNAKKPPLSQKSTIVITEQPEQSIDQLENLLRNYGVDDLFFENINGMAKLKAEAIKMLENETDTMLNHFEDILNFLKIKLKDWKEANLSINKELFSLLIYANNLDPKPFTQKSFQPLCKLLVEKMTDSKFREDIYIILKGCCECVNPKYIVLYLITQAIPKEDKENGKVVIVPPQKIGEIINNISKIIDIVTIRNVPTKEIIDFGKEQLQSTNAIIKNSCVELFKTIYKYIGQELLQFLSDVQPPVMKTLNSEFEKITVLTSYEPTITFIGEAAKECGVIQSQPLSQSIMQSTISSLNDNLPRTDISNQLQSVLKKMADVQWNKRKEGIEELEKILTHNNNRIQINGLNDLINMLKQRLNDNNKQLVRPIVQIVGRVAEACGKDFKSSGKQLIQPLISILSDKQVLVRQDVVASLDKFCLAIGIDQVILQMPPYLQMESIELKQEVLLFIMKYIEALLKMDYKPFILPLINCLCDRVKEVRQAAEQVCERMVEDVGIDPFLNQMKDLKPAVVQQVKLFFAKFGITELEEPSKRTGKTPKGKQQQQQLQQQDLRNMKRNLTTKDLQNDLNTSQEPKQRNERTPKKSLHQKSHKTLPQDNTPLRQQKEKAIFHDSNSLIAKGASIKEMKLLRLQSDQIQWWANDCFPNNCFSDFYVCLREDLYNQLMSYNYKDVMKGLQQLMSIWNDPEQKQDIIELSDLLLKFVLVKIYGCSANQLLINALISFLDAFFLIISKSRYILTEVEQIVTISLIRELIYAGVDVHPELIINLQSVFPAEIMIKRLLLLFSINPSSLHPFLIDQKERNDAQLCNLIIQGQLTKFFPLDLFPEYSQYFTKELQNELIALFGDNTIRRYTQQQQIYQQQPQAQQQQVIQQSQQQQLASQQQYQISKQPIVQGTVQLQSNKDPRSQYFLQILDSLLSQQTSQKIESLMQISDLLTQNIQQNQQLFVDNAEAICKCFQTLLQNTFTQRDTYPAQFIQFFLQALGKLYQLKPYVNQLPYELLCGFTEEIMQRLLTEDEIKTQHENGDTTVKQLNSTTLRILENTSQDIMFSILFDILTKHRRRNNTSKMIGLLVKCIARLTAKVEQNSNIKIELLLLKFHNYLNEFQLYPNFAVDEQGVKTIKVVLQQLVKMRGETIWENYHLVSRSTQQDQYLNKWIQAYLGNPSLQNGQQENNLPDQEFLQIAEMLRQPLSLDTGIQKMVEKIKRNPTIQWQKYVQDQQIQLIIQQQLTNGQVPILGGFMSNQSQLQQPQLQQLSLQQSQLQQSQLQQPQLSVRPSLQQQQQQAQQQQQQQQQQMMAQLPYPRTTRAVDQQQYNDSLNGQQFNQYMSVNQYSINQNQLGQSQQQNVKTPEYLMQKLTDMKNKVQTLVGPNNVQQAQNPRQRLPQ